MVGNPLGMHPENDVEIAIARAYNRWVTECVVSMDDRIRTSLYLPFNDAPACERMVEEFGETKGVMGFTVTSVHYRPVHHNSYMRLYAMLEERGLPLSFHAGPYWGGSPGLPRDREKAFSNDTCGPVETGYRGPVHIGSHLLPVS